MLRARKITKLQMTPVFGESVPVISLTTISSPALALKLTLLKAVVLDFRSTSTLVVESVPLFITNPTVSPEYTSVPAIAHLTLRTSKGFDTDSTKFSIVSGESLSDMSNNSHGKDVGAKSGNASMCQEQCLV